MAATNYSIQIKEDSINYLTEALFQLLVDKKLSEIKITELVNRAGVSRMAFYRNFQSVEEVLSTFFNSKISPMFDELMYHRDSTRKVEMMGNFFKGFAHELQLSQKSEFEFIIRNIFKDGMVRYYKVDPKAQSIPLHRRKYWIGFMSVGVYEIWRDWILGGQTEPIEEIHKVIALLQHGSLQAISTTM